MPNSVMHCFECGKNVDFECGHRVETAADKTYCCVCAGGEIDRLKRFENIINETGRKFWPTIGTPECRNAIHDPEKRGVFDVLVFINKLLNENSKAE